jgi:uncharacterized protein
VETFLITAAIFDGHEESVGQVRAPRLGTVAYSLVATLILGLGRGMWHIPLYGPLGFLVPIYVAYTLAAELGPSHLAPPKRA